MLAGQGLAQFGDPFRGCPARRQRLVCSDRDLAKLDVELHQAYVRARVAAVDKEAILESQRAWLKGNVRSCSDKQCLMTAYSQRIAELNQ